MVTFAKKMMIGGFYCKEGMLPTEVRLAKHKNIFCYNWCSPLEYKERGWVIRHECRSWGLFLKKWRERNYSYWYKRLGKCYSLAWRNCRWAQNLTRAKPQNIGGNLIFIDPFSVIVYWNFFVPLTNSRVLARPFCDGAALVTSHIARLIPFFGN